MSNRLASYFSGRNRRSSVSLLLLPALLLSTRAASSTQVTPASTKADRVEVPVAASEFVNSVGMNIHLHYDNTLYNNFALVQTALQDLHIHHVRDGLIATTWQPYYARHAALAAVGIHGLFITGTTDTAESIRAFTQKTGGSLEGLEAPNEFDRSGVANWSRLLTGFLPQLQRTVSSLPMATRPFVVGPSVTSVDALAEVTAIRSFDFANMHNYFGGRHPGTTGWGDDGYGSIDWNLRMIRGTSGDKPVMTTETGYLTDLDVDQSISEEVQSYYIPRILLEQHLRGIRRTYLYELFDGSLETPRDQRSFGLVRNDGTRKPAFLSLQRLMATLSDVAGPVSQSPLGYSLGSAPPALHHILFQKTDGTYLLAFWMEESSYDQVQHHAETTHTYKGLLRLKGVSSAKIVSLDPKEPEATLVHSTGGALPFTASAAVHLVIFKTDEQSH